MSIFGIFLIHDMPSHCCSLKFPDQDIPFWQRLEIFSTMWSPSPLIWKIFDECRTLEINYHVCWYPTLTYHPDIMDRLVTCLNLIWITLIGSICWVAVSARSLRSWNFKDGSGMPSFSQDSDVDEDNGIWMCPLLFCSTRSQITRFIHVRTSLMIVEPSRSWYVDMRQSMGTETVREVTMLNDFLTGYLVPKDR